MSSYFPQVGDFVMIRPWDDMVKEFGTDSNASCRHLSKYETILRSFLHC